MITFKYSFKKNSFAQNSCSSLPTVQNFYNKNITHTKRSLVCIKEPKNLHYRANGARVDLGSFEPWNAPNNSIYSADRKSVV